MIQKSLLLLTTAVVCSLVPQGNSLVGNDDGRCTEQWDGMRFSFNARNLLENVASNKDPSIMVHDTLPLSINVDKLDRSSCVTTTDSGTQFHGHRVVHQGGTGNVIALYDVQGSFCGIQIRFPQEELLTEINTFRYDKVGMFQNETVLGVKYFVLTAYTRDPATICTKGTDPATVPDAEKSGNILLFQDGPLPTNLLVAPKRRNDAIAAKFSDSNCFLGMGQHSYYDVEHVAQTNCDEVTPIFLLQNKCGYLVGFGFNWIGHSTSSFFEHPSELIVKTIVGEKAPQCLLDLADKEKSGVGLSTMHVFFTKKTQFCGTDLTFEQVKHALEGMAHRHHH